MVTGPGATFLESLAQPSNIANTQANTARTLADIPLLQAQTQGAQIQNANAQMGLNYWRSIMSGDQSGVGGDNSSNPAAGGDAANSKPMVGDTGVGIDDLSAHAQANFAPVPTAPPPALLKQAMIANHFNPGSGDMIIANWKANVESMNTRRSQAADLSYQHMDNISTAPDAGEQLARLEPQVYAQLKQQYADDDPKQFEQDVRDFATHYAAVVHPYSGRPTEMTNGVLIDKNSSKQVTGTDKVYPGMSAEDAQKTWNALGDPTLDTLGNQVPRYKVLGYATQEAAFAAAERASRNPTGGNAPAAANNTPPATPAQPTPPVAPVAPARPAPAAAPAAGGVPPIPKLQPPAGLPPVAQKDYYANAQKYGMEQVQPPIDDAASNGANRLQLNADAARALPNAAVGPAADWLNDGRRLLVSVGAADQATADKVKDTTTLNKDLTQNALQSGKLMFGSRYTQSEVGLMLTKANASGQMTPEAIHELLLQDNLRSKYAIQMQSDYNKYTAAGGDPSKFKGWYSTVNPLQKFATVNRPAADIELQVQEGKIKAPQSAVDHLNANPSLAPQFLQYYAPGSVNSGR